MHNIEYLAGEVVMGWKIVDVREQPVCMSTLAQPVGRQALVVIMFVYSTRLHATATLHIRACLSLLLRRPFAPAAATKIGATERGGE